MVRARRRAADVAHPVVARHAVDSFAYLFAAFCVTLTWYVPQLSHLMPRRLEQWMYPISKTDLDVLRFAHFLALAAVTVRFLPKDWPGLKSPWLRPLILCGQHSLEIFCLGVFLAFAGHFVLAEVSGGTGLHFVISISGILIMSAAAWLFSWYKHSADKSGSETRPPAATPIWREGGMRFVSGAILSVSCWPVFWPSFPARREAAPAGARFPTICSPAIMRCRRSRRPSKAAPAEYSGRRQPLVDHQCHRCVGGAAYPGQMQAELKAKLPSIEVNVSVEIQAKKTAEEVAADMVKLVEGKKPTLVIWQTGTVDAMRSVDPDDFRTAVDEGVVALQEAGTDVVLINPQYSPRTETMISAPPYLDNMRVVAQEHEVPLFDRFALMKTWTESGEFDLFTAVHGAELAKRVHNCLGRALSQFIMAAAHPKPVQEN